jgi:4-aminobutyrate aminotransferase-like enzyme
MVTTPVPHEIGGVSSSGEERRSYALNVNLIWVKLLDALGMNVQYTHCSGAELYTEDGRTILDFLSGYCVHNVGHHHPHVASKVFWIAALNLGRRTMPL